MVHLEALPEAAEDRHGVLDGRRIDQDGLEAPLQGGVLLQVLAVLVECRGADAVELPAGQHGLEQVSGVHGALGLARSHDGVELVDEEEDTAVALLDLLENGLEALLELAAVLGAGDQRTHVEGEDGPVLQSLRHVAADDSLGESLDDRRLADAGLADEDGVVLRLAGEDAHDAADLLVPADHRIELALPRHGDEVPPVLLEGLVGRLRVGGRHPLATAQVFERLQEPRGVDPEVREDPRRPGARRPLEDAQEKVLDADVLVSQLAS